MEKCSDTSDISLLFFLGCFMVLAVKEEEEKVCINSTVQKEELPVEKLSKSWHCQKKWGNSSLKTMY